MITDYTHLGSRADAWLTMIGLVLFLHTHAPDRGSAYTEHKLIKVKDPASPAVATYR